MQQMTGLARILSGKCVTSHAVCRGVCRARDKHTGTQTKLIPFDLAAQLILSR